MAPQDTFAVKILKLQQVLRKLEAGRILAYKKFNLSNELTLLTETLMSRVALVSQSYKASPKKLSLVPEQPRSPKGAYVSYQRRPHQKADISTIKDSSSSH